MPKEVRFAVGNVDDVRSSVWKLWSNKDDLYLAARSFAGMSKVSFHKSGICRYAVTSQVPRAPISNWTRPPLIHPGIALLLKMITPAIDLEDRIRDRLPLEPKKIIFVSPPISGTKTIISLLLTKSDFQEETFHELPASSLVTVHAHIELLSWRAWIVSHVDDFSTAEQEFARNLIDTTVVNLSPGATQDDIELASMHMFETQQGTDVPSLVDLPLSRRNIAIAAGKA